MPASHGFSCLISNGNLRALPVTIAAALALFLALPIGAGAAEITVLNNNDAGDDSLRKAIADANPGDTIVFAAGLSGQTIRLTSGDLDIDKDLTIDGSSLEDPVTISGDADSSGTPTAGDSRVFTIANGLDVVIDSLIVTGGHAVGGSGGGIFNGNGSLTIRNSSLSGNHAGDGGFGFRGGGIHNNGTVTVVNSTLSGNHAGDGDTVGGSGGGIYNASGTVTVVNSTLSGNHAGDDGGGSFGGFGGFGGGIFNGDGTVTVVNSTVSGNHAGDGGLGSSGGFGGGIYNSETVTVVNSTVSGNHAGDGGLGGSGGSGGGIYIDGASPTTTISHSIIAGNVAGTGGPGAGDGTGADIFRSGHPISHPGPNLIGDNERVADVFPAPPAPGQANANGDFVGTTAAPLDPGLGPLADNGGPTPTHLPLPGSLAIDTGDISLRPPGLFGTVNLAFTATITTVSTGSPFGLDSGHAGQVISGTLSYNPDAPDTNPDIQRGDYPQTAGSFQVDLPNGTEIDGSMTPTVQVEDIATAGDTFRFIDGPRAVGVEGGVMSVDGVANNSVQLTINLSDGSGTAFSDDSLPESFPFLTAPFPPHTFSLAISGASVLSQFQTITQGVVLDPDLDQRGVPRFSGAAMDLGAVEVQQAAPGSGQNAARAADNSAQKQALLAKIKKLKKKIKQAKRKGQIPKAKRLKKKLKKLLRLLRTL